MKPISANSVPVIIGESYTQLSASALLKTGEGVLAGLFVSSTSGSATVQIFDSTAGSGTLMVDTFTPIAGQWYPLPFHFTTGCYLLISGTISLTACYE